MADVLRAAPGATGLVTAVSGFLTKYGAAVWSTEPPATPWRAEDTTGRSPRSGSPRAERAADPGEEVTVVGATVEHGRDGAAHARGRGRPAVRRADDRAHDRRPTRSTAGLAETLVGGRSGLREDRAMTEAVRIHDLAEPELPEWFLELHDTMGIGPDQPPRPARAAGRGGRREGLDDFGDPWFAEPFETLVASVEADGELSPMGRFQTRELVGRACSSTRLRLARLLDRHPEILDIPVGGAGRRARPAAHRHDPPAQPAVGRPALPLPPVLGEPRADRRRATAGRPPTSPTRGVERTELALHDDQHGHAALPGHARDDAPTARTRRSSSSRSTSPRCCSRPATTSPSTRAGTGGATRPTPTAR